jgi:hypothetical protein
VSRPLHRAALCALFSLAACGCGGAGSSAGPANPDAKAPPPRAGEDTMKDAMQKLMQTGKNVPGAPKAPTKRG